MADVELLPCPFCGGKATLTITGNVRSTRKCMVKCEGCRYQRIDAALRYGDDWLRATAIAAWNRRTTTEEDATLAPLQAENERLRAEHDALRAEYYRVLHALQDEQARAERLAEALREICTGAPKEEPAADVGHSDNYGDVASWASEWEHYRLAKIARAALAQEDPNG